MRQVPVSCRLQPGISGASPNPSTSPPAARSTSAHTCLECSHIFSTFSSHSKCMRATGMPYGSFTSGSRSMKFVSERSDGA